MDDPKTFILPALPVRELVLFPGGRVPFMVRRRASALTLERAVKIGDQIALLTQKDPAIEEPGLEQLFPTGCLADVESLIELKTSGFKIGVKGAARLRLIDLHGEDEVLRAEVEILAEPDTEGWDDDETTGYLNDFRQAVSGFFGRNHDAARLLSIDHVKGMPLPQAIDAVAGLINAGVHEKQQVLEQIELRPRLDALMRLLQIDSDRHSIDRDLEFKTRQRMDEGHKNYVLNEKMRVIQQELGKTDGEGEFNILRQRILDAGMGEEAQAKALEELDRLEQMPPQSAEATVSRTYIDWLLSLPWTKYADERLDLDEAEKTLDEDHAGLDKVKARILEYLAVMRRLRDSRQSRPAAESESGDGAKAENGGDATAENEPPALRGPILCLVGPPGVGKTSLARSIARAMNRPFVRFSLGGIRDEAEIRGHRRTYIGSMPGRIISLIKKAGVKNPLMLLDELDKMASDWRGDPASALLEVLDPEQNSSFQDNYLDVGFDLGQVLFLCTANVRHNIPEALEDRLEVIDLSGYTPLEKMAIAQGHLVPKSLESHGLKDLNIRFEDSAIARIVRSYTKEAGVRQLEREIASVLRKLARHSLQPEKGETFDPLVAESRIISLLGPEKYLDAPTADDQVPGVVHGLAWTAFGGDILTIEATKLPGKGELKLTGKLGEVMQESAQIALSYVRARTETFGLKPDFLEKTDLHLHVPEGAIPKDGPSAGITMAVAILSALTGIPARPEVAMTGELTLRGRVLPIGGLKEKLLAAHRLGRKAIVIPRENARHLDDVPQEAKDSMAIHLVSEMDEVLPLALTRLP
uniref:Lon protease n=1 Tax=uncultured bacterium contig00001 TaxID=1181493 RepID=A0A806K0N0_9BACT|nr:ATP-dependent protease La Type I [uncultured bacterium contig00001]